MNRPEYILIGETITSINDGDTHFISSNKLLSLYGFKGTLNNYHLVDEEDFDSRMGEDVNPFQVILRPRAEGDYFEHMLELLGKFYSICEI